MYYILNQIKLYGEFNWTSPWIYRRINFNEFIHGQIYVGELGPLLLTYINIDPSMDK